MTKPIARVKSLEESPPELDRELLFGFLRTSYRVFAWGLRFRIGRLDALHAGWLRDRRIRSFAFITAWNPLSTDHPAPVNDLANRALEHALQRAGLTYCPAFHVADDPEAPSEASFWIENIDPDQAVALGRQFEQNAIVFWQEGGVPELWWTAC